MSIRILVGENSTGKTLQAYKEIEKDRENTISNLDEPDEIMLDTSMLNIISEIIENKLGYKLIPTYNRKDFSLSDISETMSNNLKQIIKILSNPRKYKVLNEPEKQLKNSEIQLLCEILYWLRDILNVFMVTHSDELVLPDMEYYTTSNGSIQPITREEAQKLCEGWI